MKQYILSCFLFTLLLCTGTVYSQELTQSLVDKYAKSIDLLVAAENPNIKSIENSFRNNKSVNFDTDADGNIAIMSQMFTQLNGPQLSALGELVEKAGFGSAKEWVNVGDKVSAALMAIEMKKEPSDMSDLTPEMLAMVPEGMRKQMEGALRIMKAVKNVPKNDIKLVEANYDKLQKHMGTGTK